MAERESPEGPDPDNWFDEPDVSDAWEARAERLARSRRPPGAEDEDDWLSEPAQHRARSGTATPRPAVIAAGGALVVVLILGLLVATGVFSGGRAASTASLPTTSPAPRAATTPPTPRPSFSVPTAPLKPGAQGTAVKQLQHVLALLGYDPGTIDGQYGPSTEAAVRRFQQAHALVADGITGNATLDALKAALP